MNKTFKRVTAEGRNFQILALPGANLYRFEIVNCYGSNIEREIEYRLGKNVYGISHFTEHLGFRAPKDYTTPQLIDLLKTEGTYNASTDHSRINYWFKSTMAHTGIANRLVCNYALNDLKGIPQDEFETERQVVYNEAKRYADDDQTMFYFNSTPAICGYNEQDNILGIPEVIEKFTQEDAIMVKDIFLSTGESVYTVIYDPMEKSEEDVISDILTELDRFPRREDYNKNISFAYRDMLADPKLGEFKLENESEQAMTMLLLDNIDNVWTSRFANNYVSRYATDISLTDIIREQHGLTYGVSFYDDLVSYKPYTNFACDVTRGTEGFMMELFTESVNKCADAFDEAAYTKLRKTADLKRVMSYVNQENYSGIHWLALWSPSIVDVVGCEMEEDIPTAMAALDDLYANYDTTLNSLEKTRDLVNKKEWSIVTN